MAWDFETDPEYQRKLDWVAEFVRTEVEPLDLIYPNPYDRTDPEIRALMRPLQQRVKDQGLWACHLGPELGGPGYGQLELALLNEVLGTSMWAPLVFGCQAPDSGNAEILAHFGTAEQKQKYLQPLLDGEIGSCYVMTEPTGGSDPTAFRTTAVRDGDEWVINGAKTFITSGFSSDVVLTAARTGTKDGRPQLSLILVPTDVPGFERGRKLRKLGLHAQDTAEISVTDVRVPASNLVGEEGRGFAHLTAQLPLERLSIAWRALSAAEAALEWTVRYTKERKAFRQRVIDFQNTRVRLAEMTTEVEITRAFLEQGIFALNAGEFDATLGAKAKWWTTELQNRIINACLQMHGGYGCMDEYPISRAYADARVQTIVGGTTEIMKEIIGRDIAGPVPSAGGTKQ